MIRFDLRCREEHGFEAWFRDNASFEAQAAGGALECPVCGSREVEKAIMAPRIAKGAQAPAKQAEAPADSGKTAPVAMGGTPDQAKALRAALEDLRDKVEASCDYVGKGFPEEARKIHYGEAEVRGIYGEASDKEAKELAEEGVEFSRLPLPRRHDA